MTKSKKPLILSHADTQSMLQSKLQMTQKYYRTRQKARDVISGVPEALEGFLNSDVIKYEDLYKRMMDYNKEKLAYIKTLSYNPNTGGIRAIENEAAPLDGEVRFHTITEFENCLKKYLLSSMSTDLKKNEMAKTIADNIEEYMTLGSTAFSETLCKGKDKADEMRATINSKYLKKLMLLDEEDLNDDGPTSEKMKKRYANLEESRQKELSTVPSNFGASYIEAVSIEKSHVFLSLKGDSVIFHENFDASRENRNTSVDPTLWNTNVSSKFSIDLSGKPTNVSVKTKGDNVSLKKLGSGGFLERIVATIQQWWFDRSDNKYQVAVKLKDLAAGNYTRALETWVKIKHKIPLQEEALAQAECALNLAENHLEKQVKNAYLLEIVVEKNKAALEDRPVATLESLEARQQAVLEGACTVAINHIDAEKPSDYDKLISELNSHKEKKLIPSIAEFKKQLVEIREDNSDAPSACPRDPDGVKFEL